MDIKQAAEELNFPNLFTQLQQNWADDIAEEEAEKAEKKAKKEDGFFHGVTINGQPVRVEGGVVIGSADSDPDMIGA